MTNQEIAQRLVDLCKMGQFEQAQTELYDENAISIEPEGSPGLQSTEGLNNIKEKGRMFQAMVEKLYGGETTGPLVMGNYFTVGIMLDCEFKGMGRQKMEEIAVYEIKDGKIIKEEFFYAT